MRDAKPAIANGFGFIGALCFVFAVLFPGLSFAGSEKSGLSAKTISLPTGPGSIEGLGESFAPQLNSGLSSYGIGLSVPAGRQGMQPTLRLQYQAGNGDGMLGIGWALSGMPYVQRQTDKGLPTYDDLKDRFLGPDGEELVALDDGTYRARVGSVHKRVSRVSGGGWLVEEPSGVRLSFGTTASTRVSAGLCGGMIDGGECSSSADCGGLTCEEDPRRVFRWLLASMTDPNGNRVDYEYTEQPGSGRQRYPSRIAYTRHEVEQLAREYQVLFTWDTKRGVAVSDRRAGFEILTGARLRRVDMCVTGTEAYVGAAGDAGGAPEVGPVVSCGPGLPDGLRIRSYELGYEDDGSCQEVPASGGKFCASGLLKYSACASDGDCALVTDRLVRVEMVGADGTTRIPANTFAYTDTGFSGRCEEHMCTGGAIGLTCTNDVDCRTVTWHDVWNFPKTEVGSSDAAPTDADGDALADLMVTQADGTIGVWLNLGLRANGSGDVEFGTRVRVVGPQVRLSMAGTQVADFDGDARPDLLRADWNTKKFEVYPGLAGAGFSLVPTGGSISGFVSSAMFEDPNLSMMDVDGDKHIDAIRIGSSPSDTGGEIVPLMNRGNTFIQGQSCGRIAGANLADGNTLLADINGDRLLDLLIVDRRENRVDAVQAYPSNGRGGFGLRGRCGVGAQGLPVRMKGGPFDGSTVLWAASTGGVFWEDVSGDGLADMVMVGASGVLVWINAGGTRLVKLPAVRFPTGMQYDGCPPGGSCNRLTSDLVQFEDLNGNGTRDLMFVDRYTGRVVYLDFAGASGLPANLLKRISNGLGLVTEIDYQSSAAQERRVRGTPEQWRTRLPMAVSVVSGRTLDSGLDRIGMPGATRYRNDFRYRDGYYDAVDGQFRGFGFATQIERGDESAPTLVTRYHFHTGAPDGVDNDGDGVVDGITPLGVAEEEPLRGVLLEQSREECADGNGGECFAKGALFDRTMNRWEVRTRYGPQAQRLKVCSEGPTQGCRQSAECAARGLGSCVEQDVPVAPLLSLRVSTSDDASRFAVQTATHQLVAEEPGAGKTGEPSLGPAHTFTEADVDPNGNPILKRELGLVTTSSTPAFGCVLSGVAWDGGGCSGNAFDVKNSSEVEDEMEERTRYASNADRWILNRPSGVELRDGAGRLESRSESYYDGETTLGKVTQGNRTQQFALLGGSARPECAESFAPGERMIPVLRARYDTFGNLASNLTPRGAERIMEVDADFKMFASRESLRLSDRTLFMIAGYDARYGSVIKKTDWGLGAVPGPATTVSYDGLGRVSAVVEPGDSAAFPTTQYGYDVGDPVSARRTSRRESAGKGTIDSVEYFDGLARPLESKIEGGSPGVWNVTGAVVFDARGTATRSWVPFESTTDLLEAGELQASLASSTREADAIGRPVVEVNPDGTKRQTVYEPLAQHLYDERDMSGETAGAFMTKQVDGLGRVRRVVERNVGASSSEKYVTTFRYDAKGDVLGSRDHQGNERLACFDLLGRRTRSKDPDRGAYHLEYDDEGNVVRMVDAAGHVTTMEYDKANRLVSRNLEDSGGGTSDPIDEMMVYDRPAELEGGETTPGGESAFVGRLSSISDRAGTMRRAYDARGQVVIEQRHATSGAADLGVFTTRSTYDSQGRLVSLVYPDQDSVNYTYGADGKLDGIRGAGSGKVLLAGSTYTAAGAPSSRVLGNGVTWTATRDARQRLASTLTRSPVALGARELQHFQYQYDGASNVTGIIDMRPEADLALAYPSHDTTRVRYDALQRMTAVESEGVTTRDSKPGSITYDYDSIGNLLAQTSNIVQTEWPGSLDLGTVGYAGGRSGRIGRIQGDLPGPHAATSWGRPGSEERLGYDPNGNVVEMSGKRLEWDFRDRLRRVSDSIGRSVTYRRDQNDRLVVREISAPDGGRSTTVFVNDVFEIGPEGPRKYAAINGERIAETAGRFAGSGQQVQWVHLYGGWNLVGVGVTSSQTLSELGLGGAQAVYRVSTTGVVETSPMKTTDPLPGGAIVWIQSGTEQTLTLRGEAAPVEAPATGAGGSFVAATNAGGFEIEPARDAAGLVGWMYDAARQDWRAWIPDLSAASVGDFGQDGRKPLEMAQGQVVFLTAQAADSFRVNPKRAQVGFYSRDHLGSSTLLMDEAGDVQWATAYLPYGLPKGESGRGRTPRYKFLNREKDPGTGQWDLENRLLTPISGRFLSVDPVERTPASMSNPQDGNPYSYGIASPFTLTDASGLQPSVDEAAQMAKSAYNDDMNDAPNEWQVVGVVPLNNWGGTGAIKVFFKPSSKEFAIAARGSAPFFSRAGAVDWLGNNIPAVLWGASSDVRAAANFAMNFSNAHSAREITFVGHSKGGSEAYEMYYVSKYRGNNPDLGNRSVIRFNTRPEPMGSAFLQTEDKNVLNVNSAEDPLRLIRNIDFGFGVQIPAQGETRILANAGHPDPHGIDTVINGIRHPPVERPSLMESVQIMGMGQ